METEAPGKANLNLVLTYRCNFTCRHCISNCSPARTETMSREQAVSYIDTAAEVLKLQSVGYTGGEPFLVYPLLQELMIYTFKTYKLPGGVVTNCFWAQDKKTAEQRIAELYECGLRSIVVSLDSFHADFIGIESIRNVVEAALDHHLQVAINTVVTKSGRIAKPDVAPLLHIDKELIELGRVTVKEFGPLRVGRAKEGLKPEEFIETEQEQYFNGECPFVISTPSIAPDGSVYACCCFGDASRNPEQLIGYCGNENEQKLQEILAAMDKNLLFNIIKKCGPYSLLKTLQQKNPGLRTRGRYLSNCEICVELYYNEAVKRELQVFLQAAERGSIAQSERSAG